MNQHNDTPGTDLNPADAPKQKRGRRWLFAGIAAVVGAVSIAGISYADNAPGCDGPRHGMMGRHGDMMDPAQAGARVDRMIERMLADGTATQKAQVAAIIKAALADLKPLREQHRTARAEGIKLLTQPTVDRAALEQLRASQLQLAEQMSKRLTQALADTAEVLTPEQRARLGERLAKRFGHMG